ncbi:hypothetical protein Syun_008590 [Stephania yunnanensis]|uniref:Uncharacterized protein n=1 Tax=Stephania yunnanensis TaxID=152371 RepID=A0AAP0PRH7_9MAGN
MNVDYRTIPQKDLAKFVLSEGGWSKLLLQSPAISGNEHEDPTLLHLIKAKLQRKRLELTQTTPDQPVDDEAVYYKMDVMDVHNVGEMSDGEMWFTEKGGMGTDEMRSAEKGGMGMNAEASSRPRRRRRRRRRIGVVAEAEDEEEEMRGSR